MALTDKLTNIADAIRSKTGTTEPMTLDEMPTKIENIQTESTPNLQNKAITINENGTQTITADSGYDGLNEVEVTTNVNVSEPEVGIILNGWNSNGYPTKVKFKGFTEIPSYMCKYTSTNYTPLFKHLKNIELDDNVKNIGDYAFQSCSELEEINFKNVMYVGISAFSYCPSLKRVIWSKTINYTFFPSAFYECSSLEELDVKVGALGQNSFKKCTGLKKLRITNTNSAAKISIPYNCFNSCTSLVSASLGQAAGIQASGAANGGFGGCTSLKAVWLGVNSFTYDIGRFAFSGCTAMTKMFIDLPRTTVEATTNYANAYSDNSFSTDVIICNDDEGFITQEEFDAIDWSTYTG